jgi:hypothetical protein
LRASAARRSRLIDRARHSCRFLKRQSQVRVVVADRASDPANPGVFHLFVAPSAKGADVRAAVLAALSPEARAAVVASGGGRLRNAAGTRFLDDVRSMAESGHGSGANFVLERGARECAASPCAFARSLTPRPLAQPRARAKSFSACSAATARRSASWLRSALPSRPPRLSSPPRSGHRPPRSRCGKPRSPRRARQSPALPSSTRRGRWPLSLSRTATRSTWTTRRVAKPVTSCSSCGCARRLRIALNSWPRSDATQKRVTTKRGGERRRRRTMPRRSDPCRPFEFPPTSSLSWATSSLSAPPRSMSCVVAWRSCRCCAALRRRGCVCAI